MAVLEPTTTIVIPTDFVSRGPNRFSPSTKSSATEPVVYCQPDQCEAFNYVIGSQSITLNEQVDCRPVFQATASLSLRVKEGTNATEIAKLIAYLGDELKAAMAAFNCPA